MSREDVETVRRFIRMARKHPDAVWDVFADDVVWEIGDLSIPDFPATSHGPEGVREFFRRWISAFGSWDYEVEEWIDAGDAVVAHIHQWGSGKGSGANVEGRFWEVWMMRNGKAVRVVHFRDREEALAAAGLTRRCR
jgi:ketosteroid isomerase-like protein